MATDLNVDDHPPIVAIVDDDPRLLESFGDLLESAGYCVHAYASAAALLDQGLAGLDVLITDVGMPGVDGFELHELVRTARLELPVFLITGRLELAEQAAARRIGKIFRKTADAQALLVAIAEALRNRQVDNEHEC